MGRASNSKKNKVNYLARFVHHQCIHCGGSNPVGLWCAECINKARRNPKRVAKAPTESEMKQFFEDWENEGGSIR